MTLTPYLKRCAEDDLFENASLVEVTHISNHGVWLLANGHEQFMPYDNFPWFKDASVAKILNVE